MRYPELPKERIFLSEAGERLSRACVSKKSLVGLLFLDHVIVAGAKSFSFRDAGLIR